MTERYTLYFYVKTENKLKFCEKNPEGILPYIFYHILNQGLINAGVYGADALGLPFDEGMYGLNQDICSDDVKLLKLFKCYHSSYTFKDLEQKRNELRHQKTGVIKFYTKVL